MKNYIIFSLKVIVSFAIVVFYLFYFSNRFFVSLDGKYLTIIETRHSYYVIEGIFLGVDLPQKSLQIKSHISNDNGMSIYDTNKTDCNFCIEGDIVIGNIDSEFCLVDDNVTEMVAKQFMNAYDEKKLFGNLYYEALRESHNRAIYLQTGYKEAFHIDTGYSLVGSGTIATKESAGIYSTVRTPLHIFIYSLVIILTVVGVIRYFIETRFFKNKQPKEKLKIMIFFGIKTISESIIVAIIDVILIIIISMIFIR